MDKRPAHAFPSALDSVSPDLPPFERLCALRQAAADAGWEWTDLAGLFAKTREEIDELEDAAASGDRRRIADEMGDVLIMAVSLSQFLKVEPDEALRCVIDKLERRFRGVEASVLAKGYTLRNVPHEVERQCYAEAKERQKRHAEAC